MHYIDVYSSVRCINARRRVRAIIIGINTSLYEVLLQLLMYGNCFISLCNVLHLFSKVCLTFPPYIMCFCNFMM